DEEGGGHDGSPGAASFGTGTGYVASSGSATTGGAGNGGTDGGGGSASLTIAIYTSQVPAITSATTIYTPVGTAVSFQVTASNLATSYGATGLPSGLTINSASGLVTGTVAATGTVSSTITATNVNGQGSATVTWITNAAPTANAATGISSTTVTANWSAV